MNEKAILDEVVVVVVVVGKMKRLRVSEEAPASFRRALDAFDVDVSLGGQKAHVLIHENPSTLAVYIGEGELLLGTRECLTTIGEALELAVNGIIFVEGRTSAAAWQLQVALVEQNLSYKVCFVSGPDEAASLCERMRKQSGKVAVAQEAPIAVRQEKALTQIPGVAAKRAKALLAESGGSIAAIAKASADQENRMNAADAKVRAFFHQLMTDE